MESSSASEDSEGSSTFISGFRVEISIMLTFPFCSGEANSLDSKIEFLKMFTLFANWTLGF